MNKPSPKQWPGRILSNPPRPAAPISKAEQARELERLLPPTATCMAPVFDGNGMGCGPCGKFLPCSDHA